jgi:cobalt-zinc-cadmium efflux system outer membrane protein
MQGRAFDRFSGESFMSICRAALIGVACLLHAMAASATTPSLRDAIHSLWDSNPEVQAARADLGAARARARAADQPLYNPSVVFEAENADVNRRTAGVSLSLDVSGKRKARTDQGLADLTASQASYDLLRRDVAARWLKAWSAAALAEQQRELGQRRVVLMQRFDTLAAQRLKIGDISSPERDLAGLALGEAQIQLATLQANEASARAALLALLGETPTQPVAIEKNLPPASAAVTPLPLDRRPELLQARAMQASAEAGIQVAQRARRPDPTLSLTGGQVRAGPMNDRVIGISVSIPLPILNTGRAEIDAARAQADAATAGVRARQWATRASLQESQARYDALRNAANAFGQGRAAAFADRVALLEKLWRAGEIGTSDYLVQLKQSIDTALSALELQSQVWQAWFDYLSAAGRLTDWVDGRTEDLRNE